MNWTDYPGIEEHARYLLKKTRGIILASTKIQTQDELEKDIAEWLKTIQLVGDEDAGLGFFDPKNNAPPAPHKCHCSREQVLYKGCICKGI